ncbi:hypothetical protein BCR44DRAFT_1486815 [Catenaria anguillulae PL171]|uniref:Uncharacterized protein n=1 Tax=Catenaria anguillulae PL171 TaxID=765915 RepID=A0A1Y2HEN2_9FUNG|nr:hypothetical protein BCR44DRAFT_1486815 [Catenaria anguillulae PL171]
MSLPSLQCKPDATLATDGGIETSLTETQSRKEAPFDPLILLNVTLAIRRAIVSTQVRDIKALVADFVGTNAHEETAQDTLSSNSQTACVALLDVALDAFFRLDGGFNIPDLLSPMFAAYVQAVAETLFVDGAAERNFVIATASSPSGKFANDFNVRLMSHGSVIDAMFVQEGPAEKLAEVARYTAQSIKMQALGRAIRFKRFVAVPFVATTNGQLTVAWSAPQSAGYRQSRNHAMISSITTKSHSGVQSPPLQLAVHEKRPRVADHALAQEAETTTRLFESECPLEPARQRRRLRDSRPVESMSCDDGYDGDIDDSLVGAD